MGTSQGKDRHDSEASTATEDDTSFVSSTNAASFVAPLRIDRRIHHEPDSLSNPNSSTSSLQGTPARSAQALSLGNCAAALAPASSAPLPPKASSMPVVVQSNQLLSMPASPRILTTTSGNIATFLRSPAHAAHPVSGLQQTRSNPPFDTDTAAKIRANEMLGDMWIKSAMTRMDLRVSHRLQVQCDGSPMHSVGSLTPSSSPMVGRPRARALGSPLSSTRSDSSLASSTQPTSTFAPRHAIIANAVDFDEKYAQSVQYLKANLTQQAPLRSRSLDLPHWQPR